MDDFDTSEILEELIARIKLTNGLEFCDPEKIQEAIELMDNFLNEEF